MGGAGRAPEHGGDDDEQFGREAVHQPDRERLGSPGTNQRQGSSTATEMPMRGDTPGVIELMDRHFGSHSYSLWHLFQDEKRRVIGQILESTLKEIQASFHRIYEDNYPTMLALKDMGIPLPGFLGPFIILNKDLEHAHDQEMARPEARAIARKFGDWGSSGPQLLGYAATRDQRPDVRPPGSPPRRRRRPRFAASRSRRPPPEIDCEEQNISSLRDRIGEMREAADKGDQRARDWLEAAGSLSRRLGIKVRN
jgi:hypothetical protein